MVPSLFLQKLLYLMGLWCDCLHQCELTIELIVSTHAAGLDRQAILQISERQLHV